MPAKSGRGKASERSAHAQTAQGAQESERAKERAQLLSKPIKPVDFSKVSTVSDLVEAFKNTSIQARNIGQCADVVESMLKDKSRPTVILGLSGPLIAAGLRKVIRDMIELGIVDVIASTGAVLYQDFYQARGFKHYKGSTDMDDTKLRDHYIDRIYDTLVDELKFEETDRYISTIMQKLENRAYSSREFLSILGKHADDEESILYTAYKHGVPVFSPALNDSSIGIGLTIYHAKNRGKPHATIDPIQDNYELTEIILKSSKTAVIYVGGGTPKNWINDSEVMAQYVFNPKIHGHEYAIQITTANPTDGGLSGSTLQEAQSWGKIDKKATKATAYVEASVALPLIVGSIIQKGVWKNRPRLQFKWKGDELVAVEKK
ncbi:MAG: deoxyhypusine synthase family protein [Candidatus Thermoplasmatota archaeon]|nr:deoxyhypusine synthase family protein [Candidatus Thermoplasmatota archaeon]